MLQGLVHVLNLTGAGFNQVVAMAHQGTQGADVFCRAEGGTEKAVGMKLLDPLAVEDVGLAAGDVLDMTGVDEEDFKAPCFQDIIAGNPVDTGTCPGLTSTG